MKKNKMMRIAALLFVAVLLTTSVISGTFAKYVTKGEVADQARVAKFGVTINGSGSLFAQTYYRANQNKPANVEDSSNGKLLTVESSNGDKLVAPGTRNGEGMSLAISGQPEVDVLITLKIEDGSKDVWLLGGETAFYPDRTTAALGDAFLNAETYNPIVYTLKLGGKTLVKGTLDEVKEYLNDYSLYVNANTDLTTDVADYTYTLTWEWKFEDNTSDDAKLLQDRQDTLLGDIAAFRNGNTCQMPNEGPELTEGAHYNIDVDVKISITVTQVD